MMTRSAVGEYAAAVRARYKLAGKQEKGRILDEFCQNTGMHRKAAVRLLNKETKPRLEQRGRPRRYGLDFLEVLVRLWEVGDRPCGKLLKPVIPDLIQGMERHGELSLSDEMRQLLLEVSAATIERLLRIHNRKVLRQPHRRPAPSSSLKSQVPLRTWSEWSGVVPGSLQADLVLHCGESTEGFYLATLCAVDVATGWTELQPILGLGQERVASAVHLVRQRLPFPLTALHTDNGSEFINQRLYGYCRREGIGFSRGRPYRKNDQAYVEQRNYLAVRRLVGHDRLHTKAALDLLKQLYGLHRLQLNFLRPVRKLVSKQRQGSRVVKRYDQPQTPYRRLLASDCLNEERQAELHRVMERLNPAELQRRIARLQGRLWHLATEENQLRGRLG
jgi:hypothetical protein